VRLDTSHCGIVPFGGRGAGGGGGGPPGPAAPAHTQINRGVGIALGLLQKGGGVASDMSPNHGRLVYTFPEACVSPGHATPQGLELHLDLYRKQVQVPLLELPTPQRPELYMYMSTHRGPELHLECVYTPGATFATGLVWKQKPVLILDSPTPKRPVLHFDVSKLLRPARLLELSTPQYRGLSSTWTCLEKSSLHVLLLLRCLHRKDLSCRWASLHWRGLYCS
jgi:hypothetical protein